LRKTSILAFDLAKWLQTATSTTTKLTKLKSFGSLGSFRSSYIKNAPRSLAQQIKSLEIRRLDFLRKVKRMPRKCSSDTQPECWDRLPRGIKIEESYFSEKLAARGWKKVSDRSEASLEKNRAKSNPLNYFDSLTRFALASLKNAPRFVSAQKNGHAAKNQLAAKKFDSKKERAAMKNWIKNVLAPELLSSMIDGVFNVLEFRAGVIKKLINHDNGDKSR